MPEPVRFQHFEVPLREDGSLHELGRGAMGITYKAFDTNLRCFVALKVINAAFLSSDVARQRFVREARAAAALRHPNVAAVFHLGEEGGDYFYAMEYVDGETVEAIMKREGAIPSATALEIVLQVSRALGAAHRQGLVHRDIKPSNLMVIREDGELTVKVIDFGLAKNAGPGAGEDAATLTMGGFLGTPHFASPEQLDERELDVRSDIYSLGVTLFYMLAGHAPFSGSLAQVMSQHLHREPPLDTLSGQPAQVVDLLRHMLAKDPAARPQTPGDLRREVENCLSAIQSSQPTALSPLPVVAEDFETQVLDSPDAASPAKTPNVQAPPASAVPPALPAKDTPKSHLPVTTAVLLLVLCALGSGTYFLFRPKLAVASPEPTTTPTPTSMPTPTPTPTPAESPSPSPIQTPTPPPPDPVKTGIMTAREVAQSDPPSALSSLLNLQKAHPESEEVRNAVREFLSATLERRDALTPGQIAGLKKPLEVAAALDFVEAQLLLGEQLRETDPEDAIKWMVAAANNGSIDAMRQAGLMLSNDIGSHKKNLPEAARWFQRAADGGDPSAMFALGECYQLGKGVAPDPQQALDWINKAAARNEVHALNRLGDIYNKGIRGIVDPDLNKAFWYFSAAKDLGLPDAYANLGALFMNAPPGTKDEKMAVDLFKQGIEKDNALSMRFYAMCLEQGRGVPADKAAAQQWYVKAAENGDARAQDWCRQHHVAFTLSVRPPSSPQSP